VTTDDVADRLGVSTRTVQRWVKDYRRYGFGLKATRDRTSNNVKWLIAEEDLAWLLKRRPELNRRT